MSLPLRVAIAGLDHWYIALAELEAATRNERLTVVALAHHDAQRAENTARRYGVPHWSTDLSAVVQRADVDLVVTACPTNQNRRLCELAAAAGKHIVSVKPIAMTVEDSAAIGAAVTSAGVHFFSFESAWRLAPVYRRIKEWVAAGRVGRVITAFTLLRSPRPLQPWPGERGPTWWLDPAQSPGGGWLDHSIYHLDFLRWVLGQEVTAIGGETARLLEPAAAQEDFGVALLTFSGGARAIVEVTWTATTDSLSLVHLVGSAGQIAYDPTITGKLSITGQTDLPGWVSTVPPREPVSFIGMGSPAGHLAEVIDGAAPPVAGVDDAIRNLTAGLAFYQAAANGRTLTLPGA
jgi:predicted dehydrogenase